VLKFFSSIVRYRHKMVGSEKKAVISIVGVFFVFLSALIVYAEHVSRVERAIASKKRQAVWPVA